MRTLREPLFFANAPPASRARAKRTTRRPPPRPRAARGARDRTARALPEERSATLGERGARRASAPPASRPPPGPSPPPRWRRAATRHPSACPANSTRSTPRNAQSSMTMRACSSTSYGESLCGELPRFGLALNPNPGRSRQITRTPSVVASEGAILRQQNAPAPKPCTKTTAASGGKNPPSPPSPTLSNDPPRSPTNPCSGSGRPGSSRTGCRRPPARPRGRPRQPNLRNARFSCPVVRSRRRAIARVRMAVEAARLEAVEAAQFAGFREAEPEHAGARGGLPPELLARVHAHGEGNGDVREARRDGDGEHDRRDGLVHLVASVVGSAP